MGQIKAIRNQENLKGGAGIVTKDQVILEPILIQICDQDFSLELSSAVHREDHPLIGLSAGL